MLLYGSGQLLSGLECWLGTSTFAKVGNIIFTPLLLAEETVFDPGDQVGFQRHQCFRVTRKDARRVVKQGPLSGQQAFVHEAVDDPSQGFAAPQRMAFGRLVVQRVREAFEPDITRPEIIQVEVQADEIGRASCRERV